MDNYIVSARKYRPDNFDSVVGQDSIAITLKNSVKTKQIAQAYLFCGPRGVGKTTCARIFAKTINCSNLTKDYEPCNECESCVAFNKLRSLNIHELDAASNNSVDDIRSLIDQIRIPPQIGNYNIYIIDEVHMLSSSAFNAFLKTLEEPPHYVVFILATTEKHKIIPTILSRCQIFDFNRIKVEDIRKRLEFVAKKENVSYQEEALQVIAQKADGAMRDALSIFDQTVSFIGKNITYEDTIKNLNVLDYEIFFSLTQAFVDSDYNKALLTFDEVLNKGFEGLHFINGLASHFRDLLICKEPQTIKLMEVGKVFKEKYIHYASLCSVGFLFEAINIANEADLKYKQSQNKRLLIELALLKIIKLNNPKNFETQKNNSIDKNQEKDTNEKIEDTQEKTENTQEKKQREDLSTNQTKIKSYSIKKIADETLKTSESDHTKQLEDDKSNYLNLNNIGTQSFDHEKLEYVWSKFAETQMHEDKRIYAYLNQNKPKILENDIIAINVSNANIKAKLEKIKNTLQNFLISELDNKNIKLIYQLDDSNDDSNIIQTDEEKLKNLINKNPEIKNLKDKLNLDFY